MGHDMGEMPDFGSCADGTGGVYDGGGVDEDVFVLHGRCGLTVVGCWLSVVGCWLSVAGCQLLVIGCWLSVIGCQFVCCSCLKNVDYLNIIPISNYFIDLLSLCDY
jgi:hypothetical protein